MLGATLCDLCPEPFIQVPSLWNATSTKVRLADPDIQVVGVVRDRASGQPITCATPPRAKFGLLHSVDVTGVTPRSECR
ncbi:hypothetical protein [Mycobacterium sp.]|uniref:hypothetical protein n=1 Tax=Mycobacterium sp. TaxID=1785 RepID=UPI003F963066